MKRRIFKKHSLLYVKFKVSFPFISINTLENIAKHFLKNKYAKSLHVIKSLNNWAWNEKYKPINIKNPNLTRLQECNKLYESVHVVHIYNRK